MTAARRLATAREQYAKTKQETAMLFPFTLPPIGDLSPRQLAGTDCTYCGAVGPTKTVGRVQGVELLAHSECAEGNRVSDEPPPPCVVKDCGKPSVIQAPVPLCLNDAIAVREEYVKANLWVLETELAFGVGDG
ncbi:hypothetical protein OG693_39625 (plasmid) [Streptomyces sp. NBC_01259]|uniref:hypothetical protein n=1 Tax=Streptomyces sp. NBC_01259 TaxID=2903800 RepID=UPI002F9078BD